MIELNRAKRLLAERFGYATFLPGQEESIRSILSGRNLLVVMPTGSGKSLLYQLPALMQPGLTIVISPLISLMKDQVDDLTRRGIPATFVNSSLGREEQQARLAQCACDRIKLLYVAPERFRNTHFLHTLRNASICRMAIDEAHCISEWGHDFRPDYLRLKQFRKQVGWPHVTALTATATPRVRRDIIESLGLEADELDVHVRGFDRPNLVLSVRVFSSKERKDRFVLDFLCEHKGSAIVYTSTRGDAEKLGEALRAVEPRTAVYHAGLEADVRTEVQERFMTGKDRVVVATCAFGMGIDKADIRFVLHYSYPGSVEQYYQEIGRAGRDGKTSHCVLLHSLADRRVHEFFIDLNYPSLELVKKVYEELFRIEDNPVMLTYKEIAAHCGPKTKDGHVGAAVRLLDGAEITRALSGEPRIAITLHKRGSKVMSKLRGPVQIRVLEGLSATEDIEAPGRHEVNLRQLCRASGLSEDQVRRALKTMHHDGVIHYEPPFRGRGIEKQVSPPPPFDEVPIDWKRQTLLRGAEVQKLEAMEEYISYDGCRREFILRYFGESDSFRCGTCDRCLASSPDEDRRDHVPKKLQKTAVAILRCILDIGFPLGKALIGRFAVGYPDGRLIARKLHKKPLYGLLRGAERHRLSQVMDELVTDGYLRMEGESGRPVLALTKLGREKASTMSVDDLAGRDRPPVRPRSNDEGIAAAVLKCVGAFDRPRGVTSVTEVLTGSKAKWIEPAGADELDVYGCLDISRQRIRTVIDSMLEEGLLRKGGSDRYPVLGLTDAGRKELEPLGREAEQPISNESDSEAVELAEPEAAPSDARATDNAGELLDHAIGKLLHAAPDEAKEMLPKLRLFHPREIAQRLFRSFYACTDDRVRARVVWTLGELCGQYALSFLIGCASSEVTHIRRLAASAIGKVVRSVCSDTRSIAPDVKRAKEALIQLTDDPATQVSQYAKNSLREFSGREAENESG